MVLSFSLLLSVNTSTRYLLMSSSVNGLSYWEGTVPLTPSAIIFSSAFPLLRYQPQRAYTSGPVSFREARKLSSFASKGKKMIEETYGRKLKPADAKRQQHRFRHRYCPICFCYYVDCWPFSLFSLLRHESEFCSNLPSISVTGVDLISTDISATPISVIGLWKVAVPNMS